jgi:hypothetical protein
MRDASIVQSSRLASAEQPVLAPSLRRCLLLDQSRIAGGGGRGQVAGSCFRPETSLC